jgi:hypothetical protein
MSALTPWPLLSMSKEEIAALTVPGGIVTVDVPSFTCQGCGTVVTEGHKCDAGKLEWDLFPFDAAEGVVRVLMYGKRKYAAHQWRSGGGIGAVRAVTACLRHVFAWLRGEDLDPESGEHHLDHALCELLFAKDSVVRGNNKGDTRHGQR